MNLEQMWLALKGRFPLVAAALAAVLTLTSISLAIAPTTYTASTTLNFEFSGNNPFAGGGVGPGSGQAAYIATQVEVLESQIVAERVFELLSDEQLQRYADALAARRTILDHAQRWIVETLFPPEADTSPHQARTVREELSWLKHALPGDLNVRPVVGSQVVHLSYESTDPQMAALLANKYAEGYRAANLTSITDPAQRTKDWFDDRLKNLRAALEASQTKLATYQQQQGIVATEERFDLENQELQGLATELAAAQDKKRTIAAKRDQATQMMQRGESLDALPEILSNPVVQNIKAEVRQLENKLADMSTKIGVNHPQYQRAQAELQSAKSKLRTETQSVIIGMDNELRQAEDRARTIEAAIAVQKQNVLGMKNRRGEIDVLVREVESAQQVYNKALEQYNVANLQSLVNQANVGVINPATVPHEPSGPRVAQSIVLAIVVGLMLGLGLALVIETFDRRVRSKDDVLGELKLPFLGAIGKA